MIKFSIERLLQLASEPLIATTISRNAVQVNGQRGDELSGMLTMRNGFYAYDSALHVFPCGQFGGIDLMMWNSPDLWEYEFGDLVAGHYFFAEDAFGFQFSIKDNIVWSFNPETAKAEELATDLEGWAKAILDDSSYQTGYPLLHSWQQQNGPIPEGKRLAPRIPFVADGEFSLENLAVIDSVELMRFRGSLANQIKDLPDGAKIRFKIVD